MRYRSISRLVIVVLVIAIVAVAFPGTTQAENNIPEGSNAYETQMFAMPSQANVCKLGSIRFIGVPLENFDNCRLGPVKIFNTDTIIRRIDVANGPIATISIEMCARLLRTEVQVDLGFGLDFHYLTLQKERVSDGCMIIRFGDEPADPTPEMPQPPHGTFDWFINLAFDIRKGSPTGDIICSDMITLEAIKIPWSHGSPPGAVLIPGVNFELSGEKGNIKKDFWPAGPFGAGGEFETNFERIRSALLP